MRRFGCFAVLMILLWSMWGCGGVEPEKRAYPLVVSVDIQDGQYQVIYGMANLSFSTGQDKSGGNSGENGNTTLLFTGNDMQEILQMYNRTQESYLDLGHVQVFILGKNLTGRPRDLDQVLQYLENQPILGDGANVFVSEDPKKIMELNGSRVESLGTYLTGIYENRPDDREDMMVTLQDVYREWHRGGSLTLPDLDVEEDFPEIV